LTSGCASAFWGARPRHPDPDPPVEGPRPPRKKKRKPRKDRRYRGTPRGLRDLILGLLSALRLRNLRLSGRIGLPDPADTGTLWGALTPFIYGLSAPHRRIDVAPEFSGACLDLDGSGDLVIRPTRLLRAGLAFAWANRGWR
jgi:hypothetical protein